MERLLQMTNDVAAFTAVLRHAESTVARISMDMAWLAG